MCSWDRRPGDVVAAAAAVSPFDFVVVEPLDGGRSVAEVAGQERLGRHGDMTWA